MLTKWPELPSTFVENSAKEKGTNGKPVSAGHVGTGIGSIATQIGLDRGTQPLHKPHSDKYILPIQHMLKGYAIFDPAPGKYLACHPHLSLFAVANAYKGNRSVVGQAIGDLICIAFIICCALVGTSLKCAGKEDKNKTIQDERCDVFQKRQGRQAVTFAEKKLMRRFLGQEQLH